jgi:hypothetical protein
MLSPAALDVYEREADVEAADTFECYFETFLIHPLSIRLTFVRSPESDSLAL